MTTNRLEAFSDGVLAIIITIMVLEFQVPHSADLADLKPLIPKFLSYVLSFVFVGIYWNNHHHLMHTARHVSGRVLWANLHLLFWISLVPFATAWMGENHFASWPVAAYGVVLFGGAIAYTILTRVLISHHGADSELSAAIGGDSKGWISIAAYVVAIPLALVQPYLAGAIYILVAGMWLVPDSRIEKRVAEKCRKMDAHSEVVET